MLPKSSCALKSPGILFTRRVLIHENQVESETESAANTGDATVYPGTVCSVRHNGRLLWGMWWLNMRLSALR